jgi:hypothetical protein
MARGLIIPVSENTIKGRAINCMNQTGLNGNPTSPENVSGYEKCMKIHVYLCKAASTEQENDPSFNAIYILREVVNAFICLAGGKNCTVYLIFGDSCSCSSHIALSPGVHGTVSVDDTVLQNRQTTNHER